MPGLYTGPCKRGVFALSNWEIPLRRPQSWLEEKKENVGWRGGQPLMVKYRYTANDSSPLGRELSVKQKDTVAFVSQQDPHWILVTNEAGDQGYIPASYAMVMPDQVSSLPWMDKNPQGENVAQTSAQYKPYKSAYTPKESNGGPENLSEFFCKICDKQLNGPIPYRAHLSSKAHKEEMEVAGMC